MRYVVFTLFAGLLAAVAQAANTWVLTTTDFQTQSVGFCAMDEKGVVVQDASGQKTITLDNFFQLDRSMPPASNTGRSVLHLAGGDKLLGEVVALRDEQLIWRASSLGEIAFPLSQVRMIDVAGRKVPVADSSGNEDVVYLNNGDTLRGIVAGIAPPGLTVKSGDETTPVGLDAVAAIAFAASSPAKPQRGFRVRFSDGSSLIASAMKLTNNQFQLSLPGAAIRPVPSTEVCGIEQINGPVSWLSSLTPRENVQIPYDGELTWPARMDLSVSGKPICFGEKVFPRGIGAHAYSRLTYPLDAGYRFLRTRYAIDTSDTDGRFANVTVRIKLDNQIVHEQRDFKAGALSPVILLPLGQAKNLTLEVDYGPVGDRQARLNWIEPALLR